MKVSLKCLLDILVPREQEMVVVIDGMTVRGSAEDISFLLCEDALYARVTSLNSYDVNVLQVIAAIEELVKR